MSASKSGVPPVKKYRREIQNDKNRSDSDEDVTLTEKKELAEEPIKRSWRSSRVVFSSEKEHEIMRKAFRFTVEGENIPRPLDSFEEMKFHEGIIAELKQKNITRPTAIQIQGIPAVLAGRNIIGVAFTGTGKTLVFVLPFIMFCLEQEVRLPLHYRNEGPAGIIICPSRELAKQTFDIIQHYTNSLKRYNSPEIYSCLTIGGVPLSESLDVIRRGVHIMVTTPGRLIDMVKTKIITLSICRYLCMDEADCLFDIDFEEDVRTIFSFFKRPVQTLLFSSTMTERMQTFSSTVLVKPVIINVDRPSAKSINVNQKVEYVQQEDKIKHLLNCLKRTSPPILIFAEKKHDVDAIHKYLLLEGIKAVAVHGGKDYKERSKSVEAFRSGEENVLVATDVPTKGLVFENIQHVINYDIPDIENYIRRICKTGLSEHTGLATTFINEANDVSVLLDLKNLLLEAEQIFPLILFDLCSGDEQGCSYCAGLCHRITDCPKLDPRFFGKQR